MEQNVKQAEVFLELRKRLQSGLLVLRSDVVKSYAEVSVTGGDSSLHIQTPQGLLCVELPPGVSLVEGSCREAPGAGDEIHFRLRLSVEHQDNTEALGSVMERLQHQKSYCFHCQSCETRVLEERVFKRVLPLPNGNWNSLVDDWCCHPDPFANLKLLPRAEDCLLGDTYLLVPQDGRCDETLIQKPSPITSKPDNSQCLDSQRPDRRRTLVSCKSCTAGLGEAVASGTLKLFITEVTVRPSFGDHQFDQSVDRSLFLEQTIAARLVELSSSQSMFRFSVQTSDAKAFILLWLLNSDSLVASLAATPSTAVSGDAVSSPRCSHPKCCERQSAAKAGSAIKVLYLPCSPTASTHQDVIDTWEKDISVHPLELPLTTCQEVLSLLTDSTSSLPPSLRAMNSYKVAYMRL
ncbi:hypothetical protein UPYG_G00144960 [Umbra pygmaea]|uniref:E3 ubiquitin-protein ligase E3D n=1 Tax=Umbra pygmaea TaxID=75934 RepID=A0ABD0XIR1_UMBPY